MRTTFITLLIIFIANHVHCQWLTNSTEGEGSFLFKGSNIALNLGNPEFSFTLNNLNKPVKVSTPQDNFFVFYGGGIKAKSEEGIGNLFDIGNLVPSAKFNGYTGFRFSNSFDPTYVALEQEINNQGIALIAQQNINFATIMSDAIDDEILKIPPSNINTTNQVVKDWKAALVSLQPQAFFNFLKSYQSKPGNNFGSPDNAIVANIVANLTSKVKEILNDNATALKVLKENLINAKNDYERKYLWKLLIFTFGGIDALSFRRIDQINTINLPGSFIKEEFRGGNVGVGVNYQINRLRFGATYSYKKTNNFNLLDKTDYKLITITSSASTTQTLTQEKTITGYSGTYGEVEINELNADLIYNVSLGKESETYALLNPYFRSNVFSRKSQLLPDSYSLGLGTYFFSEQSKFLGGIYVELPDVENAYEKLKPVEDQNIRTAIRRFNFGIIARFSLNSLISSQ
jgi:hypothetical protein